MNPLNWLALCALLMIGAMPRAHAASPVTDVFVKRFTPYGATPKSVWTAPGNTIGAATANSGARTWTPTAGGGAKLNESGEVLLERVVQRTEGAATLERVVQVTLAAERVVDGAAILAAMRAALGGPVGVVSTAAVLGLPLLKEWIEKDNAEHIRVGPATLEKRVVPDLPVSDGQEYRNFRTGEWTRNLTESCNSLLGTVFIDEADKAFTMIGTGIDYLGRNACRWRQTNPQNGQIAQENFYAPEARQAANCPAGWYILPAGGCSPTPTGEDWLPASMNDIAPYLYPRPMPPGLPQQLLDKGVTIESTPGGISGPTVPIVSDPIIDVTPVPVPPNETSTTSRRGNPFGLSPNTPTETSSSTGSSPVQMPDGSTIQAPSTTRTTSNYDPAADRTTSTTEKTYDPLRQEKISTTRTELDYGPDKVTADTKSTTIINIINNITNNIINSTSKDRDSAPAPARDEGTASDTPLPEVPKLYERKYPEGIVGVWNEKSEALKSSQVFTLAQSLMPQVSGGQCPVWMLPLNFAQWADFGEADVSVPCDIWAFAKIVIICSALLLARALVFGG